MRLKGFPEIRVPNGKKRPIIADALDRFKTVDWSDTHEGRAIIRVLEPVVMKALRRVAQMFRRKIDTPTSFALPKKETPQEVRGKLRDQLDAQSRRIAFSLTPSRCFTCGSYTRNLQWGHFVSRADCPFLIDHPHNSRSQCGTCNGLRQGAYREFRAGLETEQQGRADVVEKLATRYGRHRPRADDLQRHKRLLDAFEKDGKEPGEDW